MPKVDNYIKFLNAFYVWEQQNPLTPIQECILMRILRRVNASGWNEWVKISGFELMNELRISCKNTFVSNRNRLIELGLIEYKAGKKGRPSNYKLHMPTKKEVIYSFDKKENVKKKGMINIPNNIPENQKKGMINIPKIIPNFIPYFIPNNPETPHQQCVPETPKHKTINYKHKNIYLTTFDIYNNFDENVCCEQTSKSTNSICQRKSTYRINGKNYCNQHSKEVLKNIQACDVKQAEESDVLSGNNSGAKADVLSVNAKYDDVLSLYNTTCLDLSKAIKLSNKRKKQIAKMFCLGYTLEDFRKVFENAERSSFLCGKTGDRCWKANFDWLIKEDNFLKVLEGNYQDLVEKKPELKPKVDDTDISYWI